MKDIDQFSQNMAELFLVDYPHWESYFGAETFHGVTYLTIKAPSPIKPTDLDLVISAYEEKLTIHFDRSHAHFEPNGRLLDEEVAHSAEVSDLLNHGWIRRKQTDEDFNRMGQLVHADDGSLKRKAIYRSNSYRSHFCLYLYRKRSVPRCWLGFA